MKLEPGDEVVVKSKEGEGRARIIGMDESGTYRVHYDEVKHNESGQTYKDVAGFAAPNQVRRA